MPEQHTKKNTFFHQFEDPKGDPSIASVITCLPLPSTLGWAHVKDVQSGLVKPDQVLYCTLYCTSLMLYFVMYIVLYL